MSRQNRVDPNGDICFSSARGSLMGNRGCLHDEHGNVRVRSKGDAWVTCQLQFKGRARVLMTPGQYTELFFLDEATAFAAGHRPCWECRRAQYREFMAAVGADSHGRALLAKEVDAVLKQERKPETRLIVDHCRNLPDGVIVKHLAGAVCFLLRGGEAFAWSFEGYIKQDTFDFAGGPFVVLTPAITVAAFRKGYRPAIHGSAQ